MRVLFLCLNLVTSTAICHAYDWSTNPGTGDPNDPYQISTIEHLTSIGSDPNLMDKHFVLMNDIVLDPINNQAHRFQDELIAPILSEFINGEWVDVTNPFSGVFDGNNHTIHNLNTRLFGVIGRNGLVRDLKLQDDYQIDNTERASFGMVYHNYGTLTSCWTSVNADCTIDCINFYVHPAYLGMVVQNFGLIHSCHENLRLTGSGYYSMGGMVAENYGTMTECSVDNDITFSGICRPKNAAGNGGIGGLVGSNMSGIISDCSTTGHITISSPAIPATLGGLVGLNDDDGIIENSFSQCTVSGGLTTGGLVGLNINNSTIASCSAECDVLFISTSDYCGWSYDPYPYDPDDDPFGRGGLIGVNINSTVTDCSYIGTSINSGLIDYCTGSTISNCSATANIGHCVNGGLIGRCYDSTIEYCVTDCNTVNDEVDSDFIGGLIGRSRGNTINACQSVGVIDVSQSPSLSEYFGGLIGESRGDTITNCFSDCIVFGGRYYCGGLIGACVWERSIITNCHATGSVAGKHLVGGLIGSAYNCEISYCSSAGHVEELGHSSYEGSGGLIGSGGGIISNCFSTSSVSSADGSHNIGGFIGNNQAIINNSYSTGAIITGHSSSVIGGFVGYNQNSIKNCYSTGNIITGDSSYAIGGFAGRAGYSSDRLEDSYSTGSVNTGAHSQFIGGFTGTGTTINTYSIGAVITDINSIDVGGFAGLGDHPTSYYLESAGPDNGRGTPLDDPNMMVQANFTGWDFVGESTNGIIESWRMCFDDVEYPRLSWEFTQNGDFVCGDGVGLEDIDMLSSCWLAQMDIPTELDDDGDTIVSLSEIARLAEYWLRTSCGSCGGIDTTADRNVDINDLTEIITDWLREVFPECAVCDANGDEKVDLADLAVLSNNW